MEEDHIEYFRRRIISNTVIQHFSTPRSSAFWKILKWKLLITRRTSATNPIFSTVHFILTLRVFTIRHGTSRYR